jgi:hypothetical protein
MFSFLKEKPVPDEVPSYNLISKDDLISKEDMLTVVDDFDIEKDVDDFDIEKYLDLLEEKKPRYCIIKGDKLTYAGKFTGKEEMSYGETGSGSGVDTLLIFENEISFNRTYAEEGNSYKIKLYKIEMNDNASDNLKNHKIWYTNAYYVGQYLEDKKGLFNDQSTARISITFNGTQLDIPAKDVAEIYGLTLEELKTKFTTRVEGGKRKTKKTKMNRKMKKQRKAKFTKKQRK